MAFLKRFNCFACGSTLGKWVRGKEGVSAHCFTCGRSRSPLVLTAQEVLGLSIEEIAGISGVEFGWCGDIHEKLHSPGRSPSFRHRNPVVDYAAAGRITLIELLTRKANDKTCSIQIRLQHRCPENN